MAWSPTASGMRRLEARIAVLERRLAEGQISIAPDAAAASIAMPGHQQCLADTTPAEATATPEPEPALCWKPHHRSQTRHLRPRAACHQFRGTLRHPRVAWVGGLALALGGIFLVRYSIEQDLIGPGVRIFLGALLAVGLIAAGEWHAAQGNAGRLAGYRLPPASRRSSPPPAR